MKNREKQDFREDARKGKVKEEIGTQKMAINREPNNKEFRDNLKRYEESSR